MTWISWDCKIEQLHYSSMIRGTANMLSFWAGAFLMIGGGVVARDRPVVPENIIHRDGMGGGLNAARIDLVYRLGVPRMSESCFVKVSFSWSVSPSRARSATCSTSFFVTAIGIDYTSAPYPGATEANHRQDRRKYVIITKFSTRKSFIVLIFIAAAA